jgi:hypothetical protein
LPYQRDWGGRVPAPPRSLPNGHISGDVYADAMMRLTQKGGRLRVEL